ncbi:DUF1543 domain-containing protein [Motilimonas sp. 1_MG-2023]|uniref:DUF1543 domain-containing protein n=1 Tax=Motilimonas sp. 1_MG-2023 TaxID=3062672 RepID=UPI0026E37097|nr:DUF1543 domain-containing protein [Motilimonas sp. 1_MG-2023]MDO6527699.1 DUF1543 domain-containing protein [Motilimonas sp. 1_MG-2023]
MSDHSHTPISKLFLAYLGGRINGGHIELHDVRFVHGDSIMATYEQLKQQWIGDKGRVHLDSYVELRHINGYRIALSARPPNNDLKLFFVNLGGYHPSQLAEQHSFGVFVANNAEQAKQRAWHELLGRYQVDWQQAHKDDLIAVDDCFAISLLDSPLNIHLHYEGEHLSQMQPLRPDWFGYHKL